MNRDEWLVHVQELPDLQGVTLLNVLELPEPTAGLLKEIMRQRLMPQEKFLAWLGLTPAEAEPICALFVEKGYLREVKQKESVSYRVRFNFQSGRGLSNQIWDTLS